MEFLTKAFIGLINVNNRPLLNITSEWEIRKQKWLFRLKQSYLELFWLLPMKVRQLHLKLMRRSATTVMVVSGGYPEGMKGISGLEKLRILLFSCRH
jgi:phosphoribosylamine--glycine ligase